MDESNHSVEEPKAISSENLVNSDLISIEASAPAQNKIIDQEKKISSEILPTVEKALKPRGFKQTVLADRLGLDTSTIGRHKLKNDFEEWSGNRDPEAIGWQFNSEDNYFYPIYNGKFNSGLFEVVKIEPILNN